jgi:hypothetical protein
MRAALYVRCVDCGRAGTCAAASTSAIGACGRVAEAERPRRALLAASPAEFEYGAGRQCVRLCIGHPVHVYAVAKVYKQCTNVRSNFEKTLSGYGSIAQHSRLEGRISHSSVDSMHLIE